MPQKTLFPALSAACMYARCEEHEDDETPANNDDEHALCPDIEHAARTPAMIRAA